MSAKLSTSKFAMKPRITYCAIALLAVAISTPKTAATATTTASATGGAQRSRRPLATRRSSSLKPQLESHRERASSSIDNGWASSSFQGGCARARSRCRQLSFVAPVGSCNARCSAESSGTCENRNRRRSGCSKGDTRPWANRGR